MAVRSITGEIGRRIVNKDVKRREIDSKGPGLSGSSREEKGETVNVFTYGAFGTLGNKLNQRLDIVLSQTIDRN
jgi:hypothetical protein